MKEALVEVAITEAAERLTPALIVLAGDACESRLAHVAAAGLGDAELAEAAGEALARIAAAAGGVCTEELRLGAGPVGASPNRPARGPASRAVAAALGAGSDDPPMSVLLSAGALLGLPAFSYGGRGDPLVEWFARRDAPAHGALRQVLRRSRLPFWRRRAWEWLALDHVAATAMERLARAGSAPEHEAVLERAHLLANPARARRAGLIAARVGKGRFDVLPAPGDVPTLSVAARRGLPAFAAALRTRGAVLETTLEPLLADPDAAARHAAVRVLPARAVVDFCFDADESVARGATLRMCAGARAPADLAPGDQAADDGADPAPRFFVRLTRSPHPSVRRIAAEESERRDPWRWGGEGGRLAARRWMAGDRAAFIAELRRRVTEGEPHDRTGAIMLARHLELQRELELELLGAASGDAEEQVAATAAAALGEAGTASAAAAVRALLSHPAHRVRANALESMLRPGGDHADGPTLEPRTYAAAIEMKGDGHHRVRANALRGLLVTAAGYEPAAAEGLGSMLGDARPLHRLAALWAVERVLLGPTGDQIAVTRWNELSARVAGLARHESEPAVRARAERCAARMLSRMRSGWERRAPSLEAVEC